MLQLLRGTTLWFGHFRWCNCCKPLQNHPRVLRATGSRVLLLDEMGSRLLGDSVERLCSRQSLCTSSPSHLPLGEDEGVKSWAERRRMFFHSSQTGWKKKRKNRERNGSRTITGTFYKPPESFLKHLSQNRRRKQCGIMGVKQPSWLRRGHVSKFTPRSPTLSLSVIATGDQINPSDTSRKLVVCLDFSEIKQVHNSATYRRKVRSFWDI